MKNIEVLSSWVCFTLRPGFCEENENIWEAEAVPPCCGPRSDSYFRSWSGKISLTGKRRSMPGKLSDPTGDTLAVALPSLTAKSDRFKAYLKLDWESACLLTYRAESKQLEPQELAIYGNSGTKYHEENWHRDIEMIKMPQKIHLDKRSIRHLTWEIAWWWNIPRL